MKILGLIVLASALAACGGGSGANGSDGNVVSADEFQGVFEYVGLDLPDRDRAFYVVRPDRTVTDYYFDGLLGCYEPVFDYDIRSNGGGEFREIYGRGDFADFEVIRTNRGFRMFELSGRSNGVNYIAPGNQGDIKALDFSVFSESQLAPLCF